LSSKKSEGDVKDEPTALVSIPEEESDTGRKKDEDNEVTDNRSGEKKTCTYKFSNLEIIYIKSCIVMFVQIQAIRQIDHKVM
jgi:hypothetical protein